MGVFAEKIASDLWTAGSEKEGEEQGLGGEIFLTGESLSVRGGNSSEKKSGEASFVKSDSKPRVRVQPWKVSEEKGVAKLGGDQTRESKGWK